MSTMRLTITQEVNHMTHINQILKTAVTALACALEYSAPNGTGEFLTGMLEHYKTQFFRGKVTLDSVKDYAYTQDKRYYIGFDTEYSFECVFENQFCTRAHIKFTRTEDMVKVELIEGIEQPKTFTSNVKDLNSDELDYVKKNADSWVKGMLTMTDMFRVSKTRRIYMNI